MEIKSQLIVLIAAVIGTQTCLQANRMHKIRSVDELYRYIEPRAEHELSLAVVLFYNRQQDRVHRQNLDSDARKKAREERARIEKLIKRQLDRFGRVGRSIREVEFVAADVSRDEGLKTLFRIRSYPEIRLFRNGKMLVDATKAPIGLRASFQQNQMIAETAIRVLIKKQFGHDIDKILRARARAELELAKARASAPVVYSSWGYPYYGGWGPYYGYGYGPYWSVGVGWGGYW